jgi:DNA (cytosine-5)-methyltransferase 1
MSAESTVVALFAGIGGFQVGLRDAGFRTVYACESWSPARAVLAGRFRGLDIADDIRQLTTIPVADVVTAGFPCTDLSQAGRTAGIEGQQSGLVEKALQLVGRRRCSWLVLENVRNMLHLDHGRAMATVAERLEEAGFRWAYRVVDSRFCGVPQRRQRVFIVASRTEDPRSVLLVDDRGDRPEASLSADAFGFYWTEGNRGLGWARDAVPTLKGGSSFGIPSPPAIWIPDAEPDQRFVVPGIGVGERLQGFRSGWTRPAGSRTRVGVRWKLVGNAVTVGVARWLGRRLLQPGVNHESAGSPIAPGAAWPMAAWGERGRRYASEVSMYPNLKRYRHLRDVLGTETAPLSCKAATGFLSRLDRSRLNVPDEFRVDLKEYVERSRPA